MHHPIGIALVAPAEPAAGAAIQNRCIAAAIQEDEGLFAAGNRLVDRRDRRIGQTMLHPGSSQGHALDQRRRRRVASLAQRC